MSRPIIEVNHLSKKYKYGEFKPYYTIRGSLSDFAKHPFGVGKKRKNLEKGEFWALKDVSFKINRGEVVGVIGPNGAGKSTLLKILSRITPPTSGEAILNGRVGSLLEVGTGFHQELTGRENIYLNGAILGMTRREISKKFDEIVNFSGVERFLDTPVKYYSSGMYVRLAFSVAAHLDSEILLVDEVLAVGDMEFQKKCLGKIDEVSHNGRTILFVSHNISSIRNLCLKSILFKNGFLKVGGSTDRVIEQYMEGTNQLVGKIDFPLKNNEAQIYQVYLDNDSLGNIFRYTQPIKFNAVINVYKKDLRFYMGISIINHFGDVVLFTRDIEVISMLDKSRMKNKYTYTITIPGSVLVPGEYHVEFALVELGSSRLIDHPDMHVSFKVIDQGSNRVKSGLPWHGLTSVPLGVSVKTL